MSQIRPHIIGQQYELSSLLLENLDLIKNTHYCVFWSGKENGVPNFMRLNLFSFANLLRMSLTIWTTSSYAWILLVYFSLYLLSTFLAKGTDEIMKAVVLSLFPLFWTPDNLCLQDRYSTKHVEVNGRRYIGLPHIYICCHILSVTWNFRSFLFDEIFHGVISELINGYQSNSGIFQCYRAGDAMCKNRLQYLQHFGGHYILSISICRSTD